MCEKPQLPGKRSCYFGVSTSVYMPITVKDFVEGPLFVELVEA